MIVVLNFMWHVLIKEDKDNSLQFAKVFLTKFLKAANVPKFFAATVLHYMVIVIL